VLGHVGLRARRAMNGGPSGRPARARQPDRVDEQISTLLHSLEAELEQAPSRPAGGLATSPPASPPPVGSTTSTPDLLPPTLAKPRRRLLRKSRGLDRPRAPRRIRRPLVGDNPALREDLLLFVTAVMIAIGVGLAIPLLIR
jgi:hypothetical protein